MIKSKRMPLLLSLALALTGGVNCLAARADERGDRERPIKLYATAEAAPIGTVEALNMTINGKRAAGTQAVWNGDQLESAGASVRVSLDGIGSVTLARGTLAQLATARLTRDDGTAGRCLVAALAAGEMRVRLAAQTSAHIEAGGAIIAAAAGASFLVSVSEGRARLDRIKGAARLIEPAAQTDITIESRAGNLLAMAAGSSLDFEVLVKQNGQPLANRRVIFTLVGAIGSFPSGAATFVGVTNAQGIVSAPFTASTSPASGALRARVEGTDAQTEVRVEVKKQSSAARNTMLIGIPALVIGTIIVVTRKGPLEQEPPPSIQP